MKKLMALLLSAVMLGSLAGCGDGSAKKEEAPPPASEEKKEEEKKEEAGEPAAKELSDITVAYVCSDLGNEIFAMQVEAMEAYAKDKGINFLYKPSIDTAAKISAIENYISTGVDTIICHVQDGPAMASVMKEAQAAGVKFFAYDTNVDGADAYFGWKNYDLGYAIGKNAAEWVNATFKSDETVYAASCNYPSANFLVEREQGYKDALKELAPNVEFIMEGVGGNAANGVTAGENFLQSGKELNLVVGINDGGCLGVYEAFKAANYGGDKVGIFGCDATNDGLNAIAEGGIYRGTITTKLIALAPDFMEIAIDLAQSKGGGEFYGPTEPITSANVQEYIK